MSDLTLIIGNKNYSSWSLRPWVFLKQNNIEFDEIHVALSVETTAEQLAKYGSGLKVPVLKDGEFLIWDSLSILEYVSEGYLDSKGWPSDQAARATARSIACEMHSSFPNIRNALPMNCRKRFQNISLSAQTENEIERIKLLWRQCRTNFGQGGEWLFGNYSIADAMFAPIALRFHGYDIPLDGIEQAYVQSVLSQPCIKDWIAAAVLEKEIIAEDEIDV
jgi:glutathione S-transferase